MRFDPAPPDQSAFFVAEQSPALPVVAYLSGQI